MLSCKDLLHNFSKDLEVNWSLSYFFVFTFLFMVYLCNTLLPNDKPHANPADIGNIIEPIPVIDRVINVDIAAMKTIESTDSNTVFRVFNFYISISIHDFYL